MDRGGQTSLTSQHVAVYSLIFTLLTICQPNHPLKKAKRCVRPMQKKNKDVYYNMSKDNKKK